MSYTENRECDPYRRKLDSAQFDAYLAECRQLTLEEMHQLVVRGGRYQSVLYDLMLEYPLRQAKALRPALCIATCRALGGHLEGVLRSAAVLEFYHNAFLIHDDVEDGSELRRDLPTLHRRHGIPIAVNVGDAMLALSLEPLLDNMAQLGIGKALRILRTVARMARESTEGQALELHWIRHRQWQLSDTDYVRLVYKKSSWYTFIAPVMIGGIIAGLSAERLRNLRAFAALLGVAFQMQDDLLNLTAGPGKYGKEAAGDLWEGKHTLIVIHMMRQATASERQHAAHIMSKPRPWSGKPSDAHVAAEAVRTALSALEARGQLSAAAKRAIDAALDTPDASGTRGKTVEDIRYLTALIERYGSIAYARAVARTYAGKAANILTTADWLLPSVHRDFLHSLVDFVVRRDR